MLFPNTPPKESSVTVNPDKMCPSNIVIEVTSGSSKKAEKEAADMWAALMSGIGSDPLLTDEEMASSGTQKMILDSIEQLQQEVEELKGFRDKYYEADKKIGILQEKAKTKIALEVLSTGSIAVGGGALAFSRTVWADPNGLGMMLAIFGAVMTGVGIAAKVILR